MVKSKYKFNKDYFKNIDNEEKAYILGFFYADGHNSGTQIEFTQLEQDVDILEKINNCMDSNIPLYSEIKYNGKTMKYLRISSREVCKDVYKLCPFKNKSLFSKFPTYLNYNLIPHFIRGYFDGNGCIWNGKRQKKLVKDSKRKSGERERIIHNVKFTLTGCGDLLDSIQDIFIKELGFKKTKPNLSKRTEYSNGNWYTMEYSGRSQIKKLFDYMYSDATIFGNRKYNKFKEIICAIKS